MKDICLTNARLPDSKLVNVFIRNGLINRIESPGPVAAEVKAVDCNGNYLLPGLIDGHVHFRQPGGENKEDWDHGEQSAIAGGVTTVCDMPNTEPPTTNYELFEQKVSLIGNRQIDYYCYLGATTDNQREIESLAGHKKFCGPKLYMGSSTGSLLVSEQRDQYRVLEAAAVAGVRVAVHAENEALIKRNRDRYPENPPIFAHCQIRDEEVEVTAIEQILRAAEDTGAKLRLCHVTTDRGVELAFDAKNRGVDVVVEVCVQHLFKTWDSLRGEFAGFNKMNPPFRKPETVLRLQQLVLQPDFVEVTATDHAPHTITEKSCGQYNSTPSGVPGVQTRLYMLWRLVANGLMSVERFVELTSGKEAELLGINKGKIGVGAIADLIVLDPSPVWRIHNDWIKSKCGWTPFHLEEVQGQLRTVIRHGQIIYSL